MSDGQYIQKRIRQKKAARATGVVLTVSIHALLIGSFFVTGFTYLYPPPPEQEQILIEFEEVEVKKPEQVWNGTQPRAEEPSKDINLVQASEAQHIGTKANEAQEATIGDKGDVEVPEPPREKPIDTRALFSAADNEAKKDTVAAQTAREVSDALKEGHALGNTQTGKTTGDPTARLKGRTLNGTLPKPSANFDREGIVVVEIWVNQYGVVETAVPGAEGTTVTDKDLWNAARRAAMKASFNMSADAPVLQKGTITYKFKITR